MLWKHVEVREGLSHRSLPSTLKQCILLFSDPYVNQIGPLPSKDPPDGTSFLTVGALELLTCATTCNLTWILKI